MEIILSAIVGLLFYAAILRWIFKVDKQLENQEVLIQLLGQMLLRQGLSETEVRDYQS